MKGKLHLIIFRADLGGHFFYRRVARTPNSTYKKLAVQWLNKALCFVSSFVVADSFRLRNRQLLVAAKRQAMKKLFSPPKDVIFDASILRFKAH
jgi:hypothetical protein